MRTRRRPALQDKTPGNTPQKPKSKTTRTAKPKLIPVVEITTRPRRAAKAKKVEKEKVEAEPMEVEEQEEESVEGELDQIGDTLGTRCERGGSAEAHLAQEATPVSPTPRATRRGTVRKSPPTTRAKRGRPRKAKVVEEAEEEEEAEQVRGASNGLLVLDVGLTSVLDHVPAPEDADMDVPVAEESDAGEYLHTETRITYPYSPQASEPPLDERHVEQPQAQALRMLPSPASPSGEHQRTRRPLGSIPPTTFPIAQPERYSTPESVPVADDESTASDAVRAILATPSPARIIRAPIPVEQTPLGKIKPLRESLGPFLSRGRKDSSIRKWNAGLSRAYSPLPPSSPPLPSPPAQPVASSSQQQLPQRYRFSSDEPDENLENGPGPVYERRDSPELSDDDPFGLLATERKLKSLRQRHVAVESSRAPGASRAPLGTLALDEVPSSVLIPDKIPTPMPSDEDHNIDDLYLDVDPVRPSHHDDSDGSEYEDRENVPSDDYDLNEDKENLEPSPLVFDHKENDQPLEEGELEIRNSDEENIASVAPILLASAKAKRSLDELLAPSSSSASPTHALRTPHKHRTAHQRSPLPTPHFSDDGDGIFADSPLTARSMRNSSPSPVKPSVVRPKGPRRPLATLELEEPESPKVAGKKRTRAQVEESSEESDPRAAVRKLEALLPKRSKTRATAATKAARGRPAVRGKGKGRENIPQSESSSETSEDVDSSPPKAPPTRGRGRGRGAARGRGRGRGRGRAAAPVSSGSRAAAPATRGRSTSRGRPVSKGKGKEKAVEEDPEEAEVRGAGGFDSPSEDWC